MRKGHDSYHCPEEDSPPFLAGVARHALQPAAGNLDVVPVDLEVDYRNGVVGIENAVAADFGTVAPLLA